MRGLLKEQSLSGRVLRTLLVFPFLVYLVYVSFIVYAWAKSIIDFKLNGAAQVLNNLEKPYSKNILSSGVATGKELKTALFEYSLNGQHGFFWYYWGEKASENSRKYFPRDQEEADEYYVFRKEGRKWVVACSFRKNEFKGDPKRLREVVEQFKVDLNKQIWDFPTELNFYLKEGREEYEGRFGYLDNIVTISFYWFWIGALLIIWFYGVIIALSPPSKVILYPVVLLPALLLLFLIYRYIAFGRMRRARR